MYKGTIAVIVSVMFAEKVIGYTLIVLMVTHSIPYQYITFYKLFHTKFEKPYKDGGWQLSVYYGNEVVIHNEYQPQKL